MRGNKSYKTEEFYRQVLDCLHEGVYFVDTHRTITFWNKTAERITGFTAEEVLGTRCQDNILNHMDDEGENLCTGRCPLAETLKDGIVREERIYLHHKAGHRVPVFMRASPILNEEGRITGAFETFVDVALQNAALRQINQLKVHALVDPLTQLGNRRYTETTLDGRLEEMRRYHRLFGLLYVDLDFFNNLNETEGHERGDQALKTIAATLGNGVRAFDFVGRWSGDKFLIIVVNVKARELKKVAERIRALVEQSSISRPSNPIQVTASVGGTIARLDDTCVSIIQRAEGMMRKSKAEGRNRVTLDSTSQDMEVSPAR